MKYQSVVQVQSAIAPDVSYSVAKMSFSRRSEVLRQVRELARKMEFLEAGQEPGQKMDAVLLRVEVERLYLRCGLLGVSGLELDGMEATPETLAEAGPENLFREALTAVRAQMGLTGDERKN